MGKPKWREARNTIPYIHLIFYFLMIFIASSTIAIEDKTPPAYLYHFCSTNKNFTLNSSYHSNLNTLLSSLSSHVATSAAEFYNTTVTTNDISNTVHGLFLCRGDVTRQACKNCVQLATKNITTLCLYSKEAIVWYHECLVRYSNRYIFSHMEEWPRFKVVNYSTISNSPEQRGVGWVLANTMNEAIAEAVEDDKEKKFVTRVGKFEGEKVYVLVQCSPDLTAGDCRRCLKDMMADISLCCLGKDGGMVLYPSCSLMFCSRIFYREVEVVHAPANARGSRGYVSIGDGGKGNTRPHSKVLNSVHN